MMIDLQGVRAALFDLDGTMINSEAIHFEAIVAVVGNGDPKKLEELYNGHSDEEVYQALKVSMPYPEFKARKEVHMREIIKTIKNPEDKLNPGLTDFLKFLKENSIICAVVSASETETAIELLESFKLSSYFDFRVFREDTHLSKPNPSPYLKVMRELKLKADECLIFEDSKVGIEAAVQSGGRVTQVLTFHNPATIDQRVNQISSFEELLNPHQT